MMSLVVFLMKVDNDYEEKTAEGVIDDLLDKKFVLHEFQTDACFVVRHGTRSKLTVEVCLSDHMKSSRQGLYVNLIFDTVH